MNEFPSLNFFEFCHLEELTQQNPQASLNTTKMHKDWRLLSVVLIGVHSKRCCRVALFLANLAGVAHVHVLGLNVLFQVVLLLECAEAGAALHPNTSSSSRARPIMLFMIAS